MGLLTALLMSTSLGSAAPIHLGRNGHVYNPSWSPDGKWLAFEVNQYEGSVDLFVVQLQGTSPAAPPHQVVLPGAGSAFAAGNSVSASPNWHPQGQLIFEGSNSGSAMRLYYWAPGRTSAVELLSSSEVQGDLSWPAVSADGKQVAFVSDATGSGDVYVWNQATNEVSSLMNSAFSEMAPRYDTTSDRISYSRKNLGGEDIFVWSGGSSTAWVGGNGDQTRPVWAGNKLVFFTNERGQDHWDIAVSSGPRDKRIIARDVRLPLRSTPAVSVDSQWVAYGLDDPKEGGKIMLAKLDGSKQVAVKTGLVACGEPALAQVGDKVLLAYTALPNEGADWRQLHLMDVTSQMR